MSSERKVKNVFSPRFDEAGWATVQSALDSWPRTARLTVLLLAASTPLGVTAVIIMSKWP